MAKNSGGAAAAGGIDFQNRVAAWLATRILAEEDAVPIWGLSSKVTLEELWCETELPVDDILVRTSEDGGIFVQAKTHLSLSGDSNSPLRSVATQFVRQYLHYQSKPVGRQFWSRKLDRGMDRLLLALGPKSPEAFQQHLPSVLARISQSASTEPLESAAKNKNEAEALKALKDALTGAWTSVAQVVPTEQDLQGLLSVISIHTFDLDADGTDELSAKELLARSVIGDKSQASAAWNTLISTCGKLAVDRSGADRPGLHDKLLKAGLTLQTPPSFHPDTKRLAEVTDYSCRILSDLSHIRLAGKTLKIVRDSTRKLREAAEVRSLVVVGEPGAGKSAAIYDLAQLLKSEHRTCVLLAADRLTASSPALLRSELGLNHDLHEVLANWPGEEPAFLLIDALDAARAEPVATCLRDLIAVTTGKAHRWRIIASVRKFDLRYSPHLRALFRGVPPSEDLADSDFSDTAHVSIPLLDAAEIGQLADQSAPLHELSRTAPAAFKELLRRPFNLRLAALLLESGATQAKLSGMNTQLELLESYWSYRVLKDDGLADERERVLRSACGEMIGSRRMQVDRAVISGAASGNVLRDLLSSDVLAEWRPTEQSGPERAILTFSHHVLFDYSCARLLLRGDREGPEKSLASDPALALVARPCFDFHFRYLWSVDPTRKPFWSVNLAIDRNPQIHLIAKLIGPSVGAHSAAQVKDLAPLIEGLISGTQTSQSQYESVLGHTLGALLAAGNPEELLTGGHAGPWAEFLRQITTSIRRSLAYLVRPVLSVATEHPHDLTASQGDAFGVTARRLLKFAWANEPRDMWLIVHSLQAVCRTFEYHPKEAKTLLRQALETKWVDTYGYEELPWISREVERLIRIDPDFVEQVYSAVFSHFEDSRAETSMGGGRILSMTSNRQQDFDMAKFTLAEVFRKYLEHAQSNAIRSLVSALAHYVEKRHQRKAVASESAVFEFVGERARIASDFSSVWDQGATYSHDDPIKMLDAFDSFLGRFEDNKASQDQLLLVLREIAKHNKSAVIWKRLLQLGVRREALSRHLFPLAHTLPLLINVDTTVAAGAFLKKYFERMTPETRTIVESTILSIPGQFSNKPEVGTRMRNRLLGCLAGEHLISAESKKLLAELRTSKAIPPNDPFVSWTSSVDAVNEVDYWREQGVSVDSVANQAIISLEAPIREFNKSYLNVHPSKAAIQSIIAKIASLEDGVGKNLQPDAHPSMRDHALSTLITASKILARSPALKEVTGVEERILQILISASTHPRPEYREEEEARFNQSPSWGVEPRIEAAEGLMIFASNPAYADAVSEHVRRLSSDPVGSVRFQVVSRLTLLYQSNPKEMWSLIERVANEEKSPGVIEGFCGSVLGPLCGPHLDKVFPVVKHLLHRALDLADSSKVRDVCLNLVAGAYIWRDHSGAQALLEEVQQRIMVAPDDVLSCLRDIREPINVTPKRPIRTGHNLIQRRVFDLLLRVLRAVRTSLRGLSDKYSLQAGTQWSKEDSVLGKKLALIADSTASDLYFASGASEQSLHPRSDAPQPTVEVRERFYSNIRPLLDEFAGIAIPAITHHLLQLLEDYIEIDPKDVFLKIGAIVKGGAEGGYQYESLAVELVVRIVERYLAEYRPLFREDDSCRDALLDLLDVFVKVGWPSARRITYRLQEIYR